MRQFSYVGKMTKHHQIKNRVLICHLADDICTYKNSE